MAFTAQQVITNAYYLSNIVARDLETVTNAQLDDGLFRLNGFIVKKGANIKLIPYYTVFEDNFVAGEEKIFIPNLVEIETMTFFLDNPDGSNPIRYNMRESTRYDYFATGRVEEIDSLPYEWRMERVKGGCDVYVYYKPLEDYLFQITGKFLIQKVALNQDLEVVFDDFYIEYLMYGLARYLCEFYGVVTPDTIQRELADLENHLRTLSPMDFTLRKLEYFSSQRGFNYADAIIGRGWRPS